MNFRFWTKSWRKYSEEEWEHRQASRMKAYRLGDSDGTRINEPTDGEAYEPAPLRWGDRPIGRDQGE